MVTNPFRFTSGLLAQTTAFVPALAVGDGVKVMVSESVTAVQFPIPVVVSVSTIDPELISVCVGEYVGFSEFEFGVNDPCPPLHVPPLALVTAPERVINGLFEQIS